MLPPFLLTLHPFLSPPLTLCTRFVGLPLLTLRTRSGKRSQVVRGWSRPTATGSRRSQAGATAETATRASTSTGSGKVKILCPLRTPKPACCFHNPGPCASPSHNVWSHTRWKYLASHACSLTRFAPSFVHSRLYLAPLARPTRSPRSSGHALGYANRFKTQIATPSSLAPLAGTGGGRTRGPTRTSTWGSGTWG